MSEGPDSYRLPEDTEDREALQGRGLWRRDLPDDWNSVTAEERAEYLRQHDVFMAERAEQMRDYYDMYERQWAGPEPDRRPGEEPEPPRDETTAEYEERWEAYITEHWPHPETMDPVPSDLSMEGPY